MNVISETHRLLAAATGTAFLVLSSLASAQQAPIVQPGAPGEPTRELSAEEAIEIADTGYTDADLDFMRGMIPHHQQALEMAELVADRTNNAEVIDIAGRINASQSDEIEFMQGWLTDRGEDAADPMAHHNHHGKHDMPPMAGMASPEQMARLADSKSTDFDRLFLELMITHHEGAITMVEDLLEQPGSAYDPVLFDFVSDVRSDQRAEIRRMHGMLLELDADPRATLAAGFLDAGEAISNLKLINSQQKPTGFYDPENPAGLSWERLQEIQAEEARAAGEEIPVVSDREARQEEEDEEDMESPERGPLLDFANTDMAFAGDVLVAGNYHGYNIYKLDDAGIPVLLSSIVCPGGQGDVSIVGHLLIMSVEQTRGRLDCGLQGITEDVSADRFRGLRIFDISDLTRPKQVGAVQTCRGSHTHSVVSGPDKDGKIIVYNSGTSSVREYEELEGCIGEIPGDTRTALFRIDVIEIPMNYPWNAKIIDSPAVFADEETGELAGLWRGGDHGEGTQESRVTNQCHDITVFPAAGIAAGACSGNGIIFDISNPREPKRIDDVVDKGFAYWHSATFNNDGTKVIFTDEWGGGGRARCRAYDPLDWGADAIYDIVDNELVYRSHYKMPAPQGEQENCVAHNGSIIPVPGRDIFVQAWYQGGISVVDFTDSSQPKEIAYFDRGPIDAEEMIVGGYWSTYWFNGRIYGTEISRGLDTFELAPSDYMTENEIAAAALADHGEVFNPQKQLPVTWPAVPVVARAYMDQLARVDGLPADLMAELAAALDKADASLESGNGDRGLARELRGLVKSLNKADDVNEIAGGQKTALADTLEGIADKLRS